MNFRLDAGDTAFYKLQYLAHEKLDVPRPRLLYFERQYQGG
jgi:hypothetical protein